MPFDNAPQNDVWSLDSLIAWLETKDPAEEYDFYDMDGGCLVGQYAAAMGCPDIWHELHDGNNSLDDPLTFCQVGGGYPRTFGAALERARGFR